MKRVFLLMATFAISVYTNACSFLHVVLDLKQVPVNMTSAKLDVNSRGDLILYVGEKQIKIAKSPNDESRNQLWHGCGYKNNDVEHWTLYLEDKRKLELDVSNNAKKKFNSLKPSHAAHGSHASHFSQHR